MQNNIYVVATTDMSDTIYYVFDNKTYFEAFIELIDFANYGEIDEIKKLVKQLQSSESLFPNITDDILDDEDLDIDDLFPEESISAAFTISELNKLTKNKNILMEHEMIRC